MICAPNTCLGVQNDQQDCTFELIKESLLSFNLNGGYNPGFLKLTSSKAVRQRDYHWLETIYFSLQALNLSDKSLIYLSTRFLNYIVPISRLKQTYEEIIYQMWALNSTIKKTRALDGLN